MNDSENRQSLDDALDHRSDVRSKVLTPPVGVEPPPRGVRAMAFVRWLMLVLSLAAAGFSLWSYADAGGKSISQPRYFCPMHPQIVAADPGECPICHMTLEPLPPERLTGSPRPPEAPLPPAPTHASPHAHEPLTAPGPQPARVGTVPEGTLPITLSLDRIQSVGVRMAVATESTADVPLSATAVLEAPEGGLSEVHVRTPGFVESLLIREPGTQVRAGQELFSLYSPEIFQAESELLALRAWPEGPSKVQAVRSSRLRLELLGMLPSQIQRVMDTGEPLRTIQVVSPSTGYVRKKTAVLGSYVTPEMVLYEIADLSRLYAMASVFERDLGSIGLGTLASLRISARRGDPVESKVDLIYPGVEPGQRTLRVRLPIDNRKLGLLPGQFASVEFKVRPRVATLVPRDSVIDTGLEQYVFIAEPGGRFVPRSVELGREAGTDRVEILAGLNPGERVVSGATFLIDSESRLQGSLARDGVSADPGHAGHRAP